ncbi:DUF6313 family protein [Streptomyces sp. NEAU-174]|uniref:DUF6313 family protein n=1 Tax=Streptomyces sp. NEAU-174 TaxID=3458254 RepID=UPI004043ACCF
MNRPTYWLVTRGSLWLAAFSLIYLCGAALLGWTRAYEVLIGITSPAATPAPLMGWMLSLVGWLMVPSFVGGVTGYLVNRQVDRRRVDSEEDFERRIRHQLGLPPLEGGGR